MLRGLVCVILWYWLVIVRDVLRGGGMGEEVRGGSLQQEETPATASFRDKGIALQPCDAHYKYHVSTEESRALSQGSWFQDISSVSLRVKYPKVAKNSAERQSDFQTPLSWGPAVLPILGSLGSWNLIAAWRTWQTEARTCPLVQNFLLRVLGEGCEAPKKCHLVHWLIRLIINMIHMINWSSKSPKANLCWDTIWDDLRKSPIQARGQPFATPSCIERESVALIIPHSFRPLNRTSLVVQAT